MQPQDLALDWGWTSYRRLPWRRDNGAKLYEVHLWAPEAPMGWQTIRLRFWARRPILALRMICQGLKKPGDVLAYADQELN